MSQKPAPHKPKRDKLEVHIDTCALSVSGNRQYNQNRDLVVANCVSLLDQLYDATAECEADGKGFRDLHYIETVQGLREKTDRSNRQMWKRLPPDKDKRYPMFLTLQDDELEIVRTPLCDQFQERFMDRIYPELVMPQLEMLDGMTHAVQKEAYDILKKKNKLNDYHIDSPDGIRLNFTPLPAGYVNGDNGDTKRNGGTYHQKVIGFDGPKVKGGGRSKNKNKSVSVLELAIDNVHKEWRKKVEHSMKNDQLFCKEDRSKGAFVQLLKDYQELGALATELTFAVAPDYMQKYMKKQGLHEGSPLSFLPDEQRFDPAIIKDNAVDYPAFSLLHPPLSEIPPPNRSGVSMQALRLSGLWPYERAHKGMKEDDRLLLRHTSFNCGDHAILHYFNETLPSKPHNDQRMFLLVTHDAKLIERVAHLGTGGREKKVTYQPREVIEGHEDLGPVRTSSRSETYKEWTALEPKQYELRAEWQKQVNGQKYNGPPPITLSYKDPKKFPAFGAMTARGFLEFLNSEIDLVRDHYRTRDGGIPQPVSEALERLIHEGTGKLQQLLKSPAAQRADSPTNVATQSEYLGALPESHTYVDIADAQAEGISR